MLFVTLLAILISSHASALTVPTDGQIDVDGGLLSLPCCDLIIEGTVTVTTGEIIARNIIIRSTGTLLLGTGTLTIGGNLINEGTLDDSTGTIRFINSGAQQVQAIPVLPPNLITILAIFIVLLAMIFFPKRREQSHIQITA